MRTVEFSKEEKDRIVHKVKAYFKDEFGQNIGGFEAEFLINFFAKEIGVYFYNSGLSDAHKLFTEKSAELGYIIQEMEQPTD